MLEISGIKDELAAGDTVFVLEQGWTRLILEYAGQGRAVLLLNAQLGPELLLKTLIREGRYKVATTGAIRKELDRCLNEFPGLRRYFEIILIELPKAA